MSEFQQYRRKQIAELRPYEPGESLEGVSVAAVDRKMGSPQAGDMIARNPKNHEDKWLVAADYFSDNFEPNLLVRNGYLEEGRPWGMERTFLPPASSGFELIGRANGFILGHASIGADDLRRAREALALPQSDERPTIGDLLHQIEHEETVGWAILQALHENVPEGERPMSWSDMKGDQELRIRAAARAAIQAYNRALALPQSAEVESGPAEEEVKT